MAKQTKSLFLFAHGAGAGKDSEFMTSMAGLLEAKQIEVMRFNFPYMSLMTENGKRRPPDRMPKLIDFFIQKIEQVLAQPSYSDYSIFIGGKSMGGRVASLLADSLKTMEQVKAIICLGFPFHPPRSPLKFRAEHLAEIAIPTLILQGERDPFGNRQEVTNYQFSPKVELEFIFDGDHSFVPRKRSGGSYQGNLESCSDLIERFIQKNATKS